MKKFILLLFSLAMFLVISPPAHSLPSIKTVKKECVVKDAALNVAVVVAPAICPVSPALFSDVGSTSHRYFAASKFNLPSKSQSFVNKRGILPKRTKFYRFKTIREKLEPDRLNGLVCNCRTFTGDKTNI